MAFPERLTCHRQVIKTTVQPLLGHMHRTPANIPVPIAAAALHAPGRMRHPPAEGRDGGCAHGSACAHYRTAPSGTTPRRAFAVRRGSVLDDQTYPTASAHAQASQAIAPQF